jgi:putative SOS response-associated peptidase YedK
MPMTFSTRERYPVEPDRMLRVLTHPEVLREQKRQQGALSAEVVERERSPQRLVQQVNTLEYHRGMTGVDRSRTVPAETVYEWDLQQRRCRWHYRGERGDRVRLAGMIAVAAHPEGAQVESAFEIEVRAPLIGRAIEARIAREIEAGLGDFDDLLRRWCERVE